MTTTTPDTIALPVERRPSGRLRFVVAFLVGLLIATAIGIGAFYAYEQQYIGRVLPGVRVGSVDLSGLEAATAAEQLRTAYASLADGELVLRGPAGTETITYAEVGRGPDVDAMLAEAMAVGRVDDPLARAVGGARTAINGVVLTPRLTIDSAALTARIEAYAASLNSKPLEASIKVTDEREYLVQKGADGSQADPTSAIAAATGMLSQLDAPASVEVPIDVAVIEPRVTTAEATQAKLDAERLSTPIELTVGKTTHVISENRLRSWISFGPIAGRSYGPTIDTSELETIIKRIARKVDRPAINASFDTSGGSITGVTPSKTGRKLNVKATAKTVTSLIGARAAGATSTSAEPSVKVTEPALTTAEAKAARPKMRRISSWTTYFPLTIKNGFGTNIWLPAQLIDGYVVPPHGVFDFWEAVGPVTRSRGFKQGGAIINGRTEPQGALAGGICSTSTTLFNAALRAGYKMGARRNHYYYIDRYPLGLDATVFISGSGSKQTMSFTNDTDYPILIRGYKIQKGAAGYVRFALYSVPNGRRVSFSRPTVRNVRHATDTVQYTKSLRTGTSERVEFPVDGKQVWVTRTVRDRKGNLLHRETYYSNYSRITGITLVGRG